MTPQLIYKCHKCERTVEIAWNPLALFQITEMMAAMQDALEKLGWLIGETDICPNCREKETK